MKLPLLLAFAVAGLVPLAASAQTVPEPGLAAEMAGQWADAVKAYEAALAVDPAQAHLWERIADIRATRLDSPRGAAAALAEAVRHAPNDARLHHKLAQAHAAAQNAPAALAAASRAVALGPGNVTYLRTHAEIAVWNQDLTAAQTSYRRILTAEPDDRAARLGLARTSRWQGRLAESEDAYQAHLARHTDDADAWIEYVGVVAERGDYAHAIELLEHYRARFGETVAYRKQKARILAWAERPAAALALVDALAPTLPGDYDLGYTRTVALHHANRPREALASLADTALLRLGSREVDDLTRFVHTPLRSRVTLDAGYAESSDDITLRHAGLHGEYALTPETRLTAGVGRQRISAAAGSTYVRPDGGTALGYTRATLGVKHRFTPMLAVDAEAGSGQAAGDARAVYALSADLEPADAIRLRVSHQQDLYLVSPRAGALGIERRASTLDASWAPDLRYTVDARLGYDTFSDGNDRWQAALAPRRAVLRTQTINLDIGVSGRWFGFDRDPGNGYYAPSRYARYALTAFSYWKLSDDDGLSVAVSVGPYKDNTMNGFRTGGDVVAEGFFGIYRDWYLNVKAAWSDYGGGDLGAYRATRVDASLTRRF